jgi:steroid 5-alpha reductase family enzyme
MEPKPNRNDPTVGQTDIRKSICFDGGYYFFFIQGIGSPMTQTDQGSRSSTDNLHTPSTPQRIFLALAVAACVAISWWLLFGGGAQVIAAWTGHRWPAGDPTRRLVLALGLTIYFLRLLFTLFGFFRRAVHWGEAAFVAVWILFIYLVLSLTCAANVHPLGIAAGIGIALFLLGSWMNSWAEYQRHLWKQLPQNHGHLYTGGLFRLCRHPNYLGDMLSFSGLAMIAGQWIAATIPAIMLLGFVFGSIPMLDAHLADHYGQEFTAYAHRTRKLFPFVY